MTSTGIFYVVGKLQYIKNPYFESFWGGQLPPLHPLCMVMLYSPPSLDKQVRTAKIPSEQQQSLSTLSRKETINYTSQFLCSCAEKHDFFTAIFSLGKTLQEGVGKDTGTDILSCLVSDQCVCLSWHHMCQKRQCYLPTSSIMAKFVSSHCIEHVIIIIFFLLIKTVSL